MTTKEAMSLSDKERCANQWVRCWSSKMNAAARPPARKERPDL